MSRLKLILLIFILNFMIKVEAQNVTYNPIVDSNDSETRKVMKLFENYLASNPEKQDKNPYWNKQDQKDHKNYDFLESEFQPSLYMGFPAHVLSIKSKGGVYQIKVQFGMYEKDRDPYVLTVVNYYAKKENGDYKLYNALPIHRRKWNHKKIG